MNKIALIFEWSMTSSEYNALLNVMNKIPCVKAITISHSWLEMGSNFNGIRPLRKEQMQTFWDEFINKFDDYQGDLPEIFANRDFLFQFERIKQEMEKSATYADIFAALLDLLKPSFIVFAHDAFTIESSMVNLACNRKIPTLAISHGTLRFKNSMRNIIGNSTFKLINSNQDLEWIDSLGMQNGELNKIGSLGYEIDYKNYLNKPRKKFTRDKEIKKLNLGLRQDLPLIVMCTSEISLDLGVPVANPKKHRDALREFLFLVESRQDLQFIIKAHPGGGDYYSLYRSMLNANLPNLAFYEQVSLKAVLEASDVFFMINYCSTAAIEAMLYRVPVVFFDNAIYKLDGWQDNLINTDIHRVATMKELELLIDDLLQNSVSKEKTLAKADKQLKILLGYEDGYASENLFSLITSILDMNEASRTHGLYSAKNFREFLYSKSSIVLEYRNRVLEKHSSSSIMYALAFISGGCNISSTCLLEIFKLFNNQVNNAEDLSWDDARWYLLQTYIEGYNNSSKKSISLNWIRVLIQYVSNPNRFLVASPQFKNNLIKYLINQMFGNKILSIAKCMLSGTKIFVTRSINIQ